MPTAPKRPCTYPGCANTQHANRCEQHTQFRHRVYDRFQRDQSAKKFYSSKLWIETRARILGMRPLCEMDCAANNRVTPSTTVHHIDGNIWNLADDNLQAACSECHSKHEATKRGGWHPGAGGDEKQ